MNKLAPLTKRQALTLAFVGLALTTGLVLVARPKPPQVSVDLSKFDSPDIPGSGKCMKSDFIQMLVRLQLATGYPIFDNINSGARSPHHNHKVGGVSNSSHKMPVCRAADIHTPTREIQRKLAFAAKKIGFKRIGIGRTFIHLDNDPTKPQYVTWGYGGDPPFEVF